MLLFKAGALQVSTELLRSAHGLPICFERHNTTNDLLEDVAGNSLSGMRAGLKLSMGDTQDHTAATLTADRGTSVFGFEFFSISSIPWDMFGHVSHLEFIQIVYPELESMLFIRTNYTL